LVIVVVDGDTLLIGFISLSMEVKRSEAAAQGFYSKNVILLLTKIPFGCSGSYNFCLDFSK
jgi:hypothetical protein